MVGTSSAGLLFRGRDLGFLPTVVMVALDVAMIGCVWLAFQAFDVDMEEYRRFIALGFMLGTVARVLMVARVTIK